MRWFGFGFNAFGQICIHEKLMKGSDAVKEVKVTYPTELGHVGRSGSRQDICMQTSAVRASWSRRASLHLDGKFIRHEATFTSSVSPWLENVPGIERVCNITLCKQL